MCDKKLRLNLYITTDYSISNFLHLKHILSQIFTIFVTRLINFLKKYPATVFQKITDSKGVSFAKDLKLHRNLSVFLVLRMYI